MGPPASLASLAAAGEAERYVARLRIIHHLSRGLAMAMEKAR